MDDSLLRDRARPKSSIQALLERQPEPDLDGVSVIPPSSDGMSSLPRAGEGYQAHSRPVSQPRLTLRFLLRDGAIKGYSYANLDSLDLLPADEAGGSPFVVVRFAGITPTEIRIEGRNLDTLYDYLGEHRIAWVRELVGRDFKDDQVSVITHITARPLET